MTEEPLVLGGRYEVGRVIGRGGMAEVRMAHDDRLGRDVAVKQLRSDLAGDPTFQARFAREAQSAAGLNHPTIVSVYDTGTRHDDVQNVDIPYIVMELVQGSTLREMLRQGEEITPERAFEITDGVLDALAYSHRAGIIHRDIKPANVMLTQTGQVKVMDFGIARAVADTQATMTQTAAVIGTAQYLSPEQARGETVDARSDVYSAGCMLYELLTGRPPFIGDSPVSVAYQHVREAPVAPSKVDGGNYKITPEMDAIVMKSLAKEASERYQSAGQMSEDIHRLLNNRPVAAVIPAEFAHPGPIGGADSSSTMLIPNGGMPTAATNLLGAPAAGRAGDAVPQRAIGSTALDEEEEEQKTSPAMAVIITLLVLALLAGLGFLGFKWMQSQQPQPTQSSAAVEMVEVPAVIGYSEEAAKSQLQNYHLKPDVKYVEDNSAQSEAVKDQNPKAASKVPADSTVTITVTKIPAKLTIPQIKGKTEKEARTALANAGFKDGNIKTQEATTETPNTPKGSVTDVTPGEGSKGTADTQILLTLANGKVTVPDVKGLDKDAAVKKLQEKGLKADASKTEESNKTVNIVLEQSPDGNQQVEAGSTITLTISVPIASPTPTATATSAPPSSSNSPTKGGPTSKKSP